SHGEETTGHRVELANEIIRNAMFPDIEEPRIPAGAPNFAGCDRPLGVLSALEEGGHVDNRNRAHRRFLSFDHSTSKRSNRQVARPHALPAIAHLRYGSRTASAGGKVAPSN